MDFCDICGTRVPTLRDPPSQLCQMIKSLLFNSLTVRKLHFQDANLKEVHQMIEMEDAGVEQKLKALFEQVQQGERERERERGDRSCAKV